MKTVFLTGLLGLTFCFTLFAHEGHDAPGALPPPPHGGRVKLASDLAGHEDHDEKKEPGAKEHAHEEEPEIFIEVVYKEKKLFIYPMVLPEKDPSSFSELPISDLKELSSRIEFPRQKRFEPIQIRAKANSWEADFDAKKAHRFIVHLSFNYKGEEKQTKIQIETM
jgi:hypothetical protein